MAFIICVLASVEVFIEEFFTLLIVCLGFGNWSEMDVLQVRVLLYFKAKAEK